MKTLEMKEMEIIEGGEVCDNTYLAGCAVQLWLSSGWSLGMALGLCVMSCNYAITPDN